MNALEGQIKDAGGMISYNSKVKNINFDGTILIDLCSIKSFL